MLDGPVAHVSFHIDGTEGTGGTEVLTGAAADAALGVDHGNPARIGPRRLGGHHGDGSGGTVTGTVAALLTVGEGDAVLAYPHGMTDLRGGLVSGGDGVNGSCGTDVGTLRTLGTAVAALVAHLGLHELHQVG